MKNSVLLLIFLLVGLVIGPVSAEPSNCIEAALGRELRSPTGGGHLPGNIPNRLGSEWTPIAAADFDRDGNSDILFQNPNGLLQVQLMERDIVQLAVMVRENKAPGKGWKPIAAADFNGDQFADILFRHPDGRLAIWWLKGASFQHAEEIVLASSKR